MNKRLAVRQVLLSGLAAMAALPGAWADNVVGDETVVASINPPPVGLGCADAAVQTSVYFNFVHPPFQINQLSLYVDGAGVPDDAVDEQWPTVILRGGLHPGSNTVDVVANGAAGQSLDRRLVVQIGGSGGIASVACDDTVTAAADDNAPADTGAIADAPVADAAVPLYTDTPPAYQGPDYPAPVYVYNVYPIVVLATWVPYIPCYGFGYFHAHYHPRHPPPALARNPSFGGDTGGSGTVATGGGGSPGGDINGAAGNGQNGPVANPRPTVPHLPLFGGGHPNGSLHPAPATVATYRPAAPRPSEPAVAVRPPPVYRPVPEVHAPVAPAPAAHTGGRPAQPPTRGGEGSRLR